MISKIRSEYLLSMSEFLPANNGLNLLISLPIIDFQHFPLSKTIQNQIQKLLSILLTLFPIFPINFTNSTQKLSRLNTSISLEHLHQPTEFLVEFGGLDDSSIMVQIGHIFILFWLFFGGNYVPSVLLVFLKDVIVEILLLFCWVYWQFCCGTPFCLEVVSF